MAKTSAAKMAANARYNVKAYDQVAIRVPKKERFLERIKLGADSVGISSAAYIADAIRARLDADGIPTADALPQQTEDATD